VFAIAITFFVLSDLLLDLMKRLVDAAVEIITVVMGDESALVFGTDDDLGTLHLASRAVERDLDGVDQIVVARKTLGSFLSVLAESGRDFQMPAGNSDFHV